MENLTIDNTLLRPQLGNGWVLNSTHTPPYIGLSGGSKRYEINEIAVMILEYCDGIQSVASIIEVLPAQFPEAESEIPRDVESVLHELHQNQVLIFTPAQSDTLSEVPEKTPPHEKRKLCIGMATYDDYDGVYFSVQAIRLYHPEILDDVEILVIDNHPEGPCAQSLKQLEHWIPHFRYIPCERIRGTAVRDFIFREANADYVLCIDSHVMLEAGAIKRLLDYFDASPDTTDFLQGPLVNDDLQNISTHFVPGWGQGMYGTWGTDARAADVDSEAFDIPMQGLGLFACAKSAWPGFNPRFSGFGGEEGYIHEKCRQAGGRTLCLPFLRWLHRFNRPMGTHYTVNWEDRIRNYLIGRDELGLDSEDVIEHFNEHIGEKNTRVIVEKVLAEIDNPFYMFDAIYCLVNDSNLQGWIAIQRMLDELGILHRVTPLDLSEFSDDDDIARVLASRQIVQQAKESAYNSVLIFDANKLPNLVLDKSFKQAMQSLAQREWTLFYPAERQARCLSESDSVLLDLAGLETGAATPIAFHHSVYAQLLEALPDEEGKTEQWLEQTGGLANYYDKTISGRVAPAALAL